MSQFVKGSRKPAVAGPVPRTRSRAHSNLRQTRLTAPKAIRSSRRYRDRGRQRSGPWRRQPPRSPLSPRGRRLPGPLSRGNWSAPSRGPAWLPGRRYSSAHPADSHPHRRLRRRSRGHVVRSVTPRLSLGREDCPLSCVPRQRISHERSDAETDCRPLVMLGRRLGGRELSEMAAHPENIVSGGGHRWRRGLVAGHIESPDGVRYSVRKIKGSGNFIRQTCQY